MIPSQRQVKYNIALVPKNPQPFIEFAHHTVYAANKNTYLIGTQSIPHITLCHFIADPPTQTAIWKTIKAQQLDKTVLKLKLGLIRSKFYQDSFTTAGSWISLIPDQLDAIKKLHLRLAHIIQHPTNSAWDEYDPHMTLLNNKKDFALCQEIATPTPITQPLEDWFSLVIGYSDPIGQLTSLLAATFITL